MTEPLDAEALAAAYHHTLQVHLDELRELACAVATARYAGVDDKACVKAYHDYFDDLPPEFLSDLFWCLMFRGGRSVDREARTRLLRLRDAWNVPTLEGTT